MWMKGDVAIAGADCEVQMAASTTQFKTIIGHVGGGGKVHSFLGGWSRATRNPAGFLFFRMVERSSGKSSALQSADFES